MDASRVLVVGGGVAGLATALALRQRGIGADVVERVATRGHRGAGVYLPANAVRAIGELGLRDDLADRAHRITAQRFLSHHGRELMEVDLSDVWGPTGPCVALTHADLHQLLSADVPVRRGTTLSTLDDHGARASVSFDDGSTGEYDVVIGADGVHSWVRPATFSERSGPRFLGQVSWRFLVDDAPGSSAWTVWLGSGATFLAVPLGGGRTYCYAAVDRRTPTDPAGDDLAALAALFEGFAEPVPTLLAERKGSPYFSPIEEVVQHPWTRGHVVLVGDAAHAMSPNMAEGVGMAVEDALVLAGLVAAGRSLAEFEERRRPRVEFVQAQTHRRDRTRNLPAFVRDPVLRARGQQIFRGNYQRLTAAP